MGALLVQPPAWKPPPPPTAVVELHGRVVLKVLHDMTGMTTPAPSARAEATDEKVASAEARTLPSGERVVVFDAEFLAGLFVNPQPKLADYAVLAHELGHHAKQHNNLTSAPPPIRRANELEADEFAGLALGALGLARPDAEAAMRAFVADSGGGAHGTADARVEQAMKGWEKGNVTAEVRCCERDVRCWRHIQCRLNKKIFELQYEEARAQCAARGQPCPRLRAMKIARTRIPRDCADAATSPLFFGPGVRQPKPCQRPAPAP